MDTTIRELSYSQAIQEAMAIAMERDDRVFLMGEDIGVYGGAFQVTGDLVHRFGEDRVMDTPISELGGAGVAVGAALTGMRPIFEFQFSDFAALAMEQIVNRAAKSATCWAGRFLCHWSCAFPQVRERVPQHSTVRALKRGLVMFPVSKFCSRRHLMTPKACCLQPSKILIPS